MSEQILNGSGLDKAISAILFEADLASLATHGCPDDEYDGEATIILFRLTHTNTEEDVVNIIFEEFLKSFAPLPMNRDDFVEAGKKVYELWSSVIEGKF